MTPEERARAVCDDYYVDAQNLGLHKAIVHAIREAVDEATARASKPAVRLFTEELCCLEVAEYALAHSGPERTIPWEELDGNKRQAFRAAMVAVERRVRQKCIEEINAYVRAAVVLPQHVVAAQAMVEVIKGNMP